MRRGWVMGLVLGCGPSLDAFIPVYVDEVCDLVLECTDPAVRTFDGTNNMDACLSSRGPALVEQLESCAYRPVDGQACLDAIGEVTCPEYVLTIDAVLPDVCVVLMEGCGADDGSDTAK